MREANCGKAVPGAGMGSGGAVRSGAGPGIVRAGGERGSGAKSSHGESGDGTAGGVSHSVRAQKFARGRSKSTWYIFSTALVGLLALLPGVPDPRAGNRAARRLPLFHAACTGLTLPPVRAI